MVQAIRGHLQTRLTLAFVLVMAIPAVVITLFSINSASNALLEQTRAANATLLEHLAEDAEASLLRVNRDLDYLHDDRATRDLVRRLASGQEANTAAALHDFFVNFFRYSTDLYMDVRILDTDGQEIVRVDANNGRPQIIVGRSLQNRRNLWYFQGSIALPEGQVFISGIDLNTTNDAIDEPYVPVIRYARPLYADNGAVVGVIVLKAYAERILESVYEQGNLVLIDSNGSYLIHPDEQRLFGQILSTGTGFHIDQPNDAQVALTSESGSWFGSPDAPDQFQVFTTISPEDQPAIHWTLMHVEPLDGILAPITQTRVAIGLFALTAMVVTVVVALWTAGSIVQPVKQLAKAASEISLGHWNARLPATPNHDEIDALTVSFGKMSKDLKATYDTLEQRATELEEANALARESSRLKSEFMATMSHELRTPLNAMIGFAGILLEGMRGEIDDDARHMITRIQTNASRLLTLINDILDIAKIEAGRLELVSVPLSPRELAFSWKNQTSVLARNKDLSFDVDIDPDVPDELYGDPDRLTQIGVNLLSNAFKFTEKGGVTLSMRVEDNSWLIEVRDTGVGIPPHAINYIFDEFRQVDGTSRRAYGGTGLGLAIVRNLCRMMEGTVTVTSELGEGSTFTVTLPLRPVEQPQWA